MSTVASVGARRDFHDAREDLADRLRAADDVLELVALAELGREERDLPREPPVRDRALHLHEQLLLRERLLDVVEGAEPHGLDGALDRPVRGHHDDLGHRVRFLHRTQDADAVVAPHAQVGEDEVVGAFRSAIGALLAVTRLVDLVAAAAQHHREGRAHVALIIDDENLRHTLPRPPSSEGRADRPLPPGRSVFQAAPPFDNCCER
jgi:hypothetical protein